MSNVNYFVKEEPTLTLWEKLKLFWAIAFAKKLKPVVRFSNGVELDFSENKVVLTNPTTIKCSEDLTLHSDKHMIIKSGQVQEPRPGYLYSVWINPELNNVGEPMQKHCFYDEGGNQVFRNALYDKSGNIIVPAGLSLLPPKVCTNCGSNLNERLHGNSS